MTEVHVRPFQEDDRDFIEASWINSYRDHWTGLKGRYPPIHVNVHRKYQRLLVRHLMRRTGCCIVVAVTPAYEDVGEAILGWCIVEGDNVLHYIFVKEAFRNAGVAKSLLKALHVKRHYMTYTHCTNIAQHVLRTTPAYWTATYNPWLLCEERA